MTSKQFRKLTDDNYKLRKELSEKKTNDYATDDVLSNFKRLSSVSKALGIDTKTPEGYAMFMILMKLDRISNLSNKEALNESVQDSVIDLMNYTDLLYALLHENSIKNFLEINTVKYFTTSSLEEY